VFDWVGTGLEAHHHIQMVVLGVHPVDAHVCQRVGLVCWVS